MELYNILSESNTDLRQPVGLEEQLLKDEALDSEVGQSMLQLLQVLLAKSSAGAHVMPAQCSHQGGLLVGLLVPPCGAQRQCKAGGTDMLHSAMLSCLALLYTQAHTCAYSSPVLHCRHKL